MFAHLFGSLGDRRSRRDNSFRPRIEVLESRNLLSAASDLRAALTALNNDIRAIQADSLHVNATSLNRDAGNFSADLNRATTAVMQLPATPNTLAVVSDLFSLYKDFTALPSAVATIQFGSEVTALGAEFGPVLGPIPAAVGGSIVAFGGVQASFAVANAVVDVKLLNADTTLLLQKLFPPPPPPVSHDPDHDGDVDMY
jgi:hypothetical protein